MKLYRKENRKLIAKLEDALDEKDELNEKMKKIEELITNKQNELYNNLKKYFGKIISDIHLTNNNKNNIIFLMKLMQYSDQEIKSAFSS